MATYRDEAVVLRTHQLGEADRIVSLLTRTHGKVRAVAKGVRRTSSKFGGRLEPFSHVDVQFARGRGSLEVVAQAETLHAADIGGDYERFTAGQVMVEAADRLVVEEGAPALQQYRLLLGALLALGRDEHRSTSIVDAYLLRALAVAGWAVALTGCAGCGEPLPEGWFDPQGGGLACAACRPPSSARIDRDDLAHLGALLGGDWDAVDAAEPGLVGRCHGLVVAYATWHLDRALRSMPFLER